MNGCENVFFVLFSSYIVSTYVTLSRCPDPGNPLNGYRTPFPKKTNDYPQGSIIHYTCFPQFVLLGHVRRTCLSDGRWSDKTPECLAPPSFHGTPSNTTVTETDDVLFTCFASSPDTRITWFKDGKAVTGSNFASFRGRLLIFQVKIEDKGWYICNVTNRAGTKVARAYLRVLRSRHPAPPKFRQTPSNITVRETENAMFNCSTSTPDTTITWYKDGKLLTGDNFAFLKTGLLILRVYREDRGWYDCNATNRAGSKQAHAYLEVLKPLKAACGRPTLRRNDRGRIVGGKKVVAGSHPWQVSLWNTRENKHRCGGSLVAERWVITAAHCVTNISVGDIEVRLGKLYTDKPEQSRQQIIRADRIKIHPQYYAKDYDRDVAMIHLSSSAVYTDYVSPICLPLSKNDGDQILLRPGNIGIITGWGGNAKGQTTLKQLHQATVPIVDQNVCKISHPEYIVTSNMFCAGHFNGTLGDTCGGDSGGPLAIKNNQRWVLAGVISWGDPFGCGIIGKYSVYTRISAFTQWINAHINREE